MDRLLAEAARARQAGAFDVARSRYEAVLAAAPGHAGALNGLGLAALAQGRAADARDLFARAVAAEPRAAALRINLANACRALGDTAGERDALAGARDLDPYSLIVHVRLAELHEREGEAGKATAAWGDVISLAAAEPQPTAAVQAVLARARDYVGKRTAMLEARLAAELAPLRATATPEGARRFDAALDHAAGRRRIYQNQCSGLFFPFLPPDEFFPRAHFPWFERLEAATDMIRRELLGALSDDAQGFAPYVDQETGAELNVWSELSRSPRWSAYYLWKYGERNEQACARCPGTAALLQSLPLADHSGRAPTVFFSLLAPRTRIPPHTGVTNCRGIVHLPLVVPPDCGFRVGGETRAWTEGEAFAFDDTIEHEAWNNSGEQRAVLIFDVWNPHIGPDERQLLRTFFAAADATGLNPARD